jgi:hypothetical protein
MPDHLHVDRARPVCTNLRTKALHVFGRETGDMYRTSRSSSYQCLATSFVTGPDGSLCAPEECQPGRGCFRAR